MIVVKSKERGARTKVNACAYSHDGGLIGGGMCSTPGSTGTSLIGPGQRAWMGRFTCGKPSPTSSARVCQLRVPT